MAVNTRTLTAAAILLTGIILAGGVFAAPIGKGIVLGDSGVRAYPWLNVDFNHEDNYFRTDGDIVPEKSTWINVLEPGIRLSALKGADAYNLSFLSRIGTVFDSKQDSYVDYKANADANWELGIRHRLRAEYEFLRWHDRRGSGDPGEGSRANIFWTHPDVWHSNRVKAQYSFGAPGARGRVDASAAKLLRRYQNNDQEIRDNDRTILDGTFYARIMPKTSLLFELNWQQIDYVNEDRGSLTLDSDEWRVYGGVTWDTTVKTSGTVKLGYVAKDFNASERTDVSDFGWVIELVWRPRTYSILDLVTKLEPQENPDGTSGTMVVSSIEGKWNHFWSPFISSEVSVLATDDDYAGSVDGRQDNRYQVGAGVFYTPKQWIELGAEYRYETRDSNIDLAEYTNNVLMFTFNGRF